MPLPLLSAAQRLLLAAGLCAASAASAIAAWRHAALIGDPMFICGSADAHCWGCYAAPLFAALAVAVLAAPQGQAAPAAHR